MSDCDVFCGNVNDRSVRAIAVKPRAFGAPLCGVGDLTARRGRANEATRAANADLHARCTARHECNFFHSSRHELQSVQPHFGYRLTLNQLLFCR
jgi:hypothetical protein